MFCPNCGTKLPDDGKTRFCNRCGAPLTEASVRKEHDDFPKSPGAGRALAVAACLLLIAGGAAGGGYYYSKHGIDLPKPAPKVTSAPETIPAETERVTSLPEKGVTDSTPVTTTTAHEEDPDEIIERTFTFTTPNGLYQYVKVHFNRSAYDTYHSLPRYYQPDEFVYYINNSINKEVLRAMTDAMVHLGVEKNYSNKELAYMAIRLVQSIEYVNDSESTGKDDYPKYPIETVFEKQGDCEDLSILLVGLLKNMGFETCFVVFPDHVGVGIRLDDAENGTAFEYEGVKYYYVETTAAGWNIGAYPDELTTKARLYFVK